MQCHLLLLLYQFLLPTIKNFFYCFCLLLHEIFDLLCLFVPTFKKHRQSTIYQSYYDGHYKVKSQQKTLIIYNVGTVSQDIHSFLLGLWVRIRICMDPGGNNFQIKTEKSKEIGNN